MKVKELIEKLQKYNPEVDILLDTGEDMELFTLDHIYTEYGNVVLSSSTFNLDNYEE